VKQSRVVSWIDELQTVAELAKQGGILGEDTMRGIGGKYVDRGAVE
jgi:hypothetical protein